MGYVIGLETKKKRERECEMEGKSKSQVGGKTRTNK